ncbi:amino acid adenylation domain-containing protein [Entomomonas moraniae]|uniref:Amino acid adenylation domain-containing protein n=1 Tax=Entomomonas moraniae TaxID=2213226 RepID=A0A3S9XDB5_9GAMM|nr:non-ribosomal peptide synthetase [Entomomonas moraniae]AZS50298.1 amino acid adenylation domain-containing protein [Entomomonas moraniae]
MNKAIMVETLVTELSSQGVLLWAEGEQLKFKAPAGVITDHHKQHLTANKLAIIEYLQNINNNNIEHDAEGRYQPFPLTDLQLAYMVGRSNLYEYGGVGCHSYIELALPDTDHKKLQDAWHGLIMRHDMLRAIILADGTQQVLAEVNLPPLLENDFRALDPQQTEQQLLAIREQLSHRCYDPTQWPLFDLRLTHTAEGAILHFSIDLLIADFASIQVLLAELGEAYQYGVASLPELPITFRDVVLAKKQAFNNPTYKQRYEKHKQYWLKQLDTMPLPPELPVSSYSKQQNQPIRFDRFHFALTKERWQALSQQATSRKLTPSSVVLTAFTDILARWSRHPELCINLTLFNRPTDYAGVHNTVGDFIAVNVLGVRNNPQQSFCERSQALQEQLWQDLEHNEFTGIDVLRAMNQQRQENILVPVVYTSTLGVKADKLTTNEFMQNAKLHYGITQTPQVWLDCQTTERYGTLQLDWDVRQGIFPEGVAEAAFTALTELLNNLADDDSLWQQNSVVKLPVAMQQRHAQLNDTFTAYQPQLLHADFCQQVLIRPTATAVIASDYQLTYLQLAEQALTISQQLQQAGCQAGDNIAIVMDKSAAQIAAVLGVLLAGATYVPIESHQPIARKQAILEDASIKLLITDNNHLNENWPSSITPLLINTPKEVADIDQVALTNFFDQFIKNYQQQPEATRRTGYIIFTSGTTGRPKGVMVSHFAAWNTVAEINKRFAVNQQDKVLGLASFSFDLSVWDIFGTLAAGACLVLPDAEQRTNPEHWGKLIEAHQITRWNSVPAQMQMLVNWLEWDTHLNLSSLHTAFLSGDKIPVTLPALVKEYLPKLQLISLGGPTETSIWCVSHPILQSFTKQTVRIPYGKPLTNHQIYILNERLEQCPDYVVGEMYVAGHGLADGYVADNEQTAYRFITHPITGQRLYKSGDIGFYTAHGLIEILGREDNQTKIRGYRVELGEIEAALTHIPTIKQAVAIPIANASSLAAAIVIEDSTGRVQEEFVAQVKQQLAIDLPDYMIPERIDIYQQLPLSSNGKVDRKQLTKLFTETHTTTSQPFEQPTNDPIEQDLATIWQELLKITQISRQDDFFQVGGSSLSAINLLSILLARGYPATLELIFNNSMFANMATALRNSNESKTQWLESIDLAEITKQAISSLNTAIPFNISHSPQNILLTGGSGYLGIYTLSTLLYKTNYNIYCLLRAEDEVQGLNRLFKAAAEKGVTLSDAENRIKIFCGAVDKDNLGLTVEQYQQLANEIDLIIHNASIINLMDPLSSLYPTNVQGASNILQLATTNKVKQINYVSTVAVHHALTEHDENKPVPESTSISRWRDLELTYEQSKIMAENIFYLAREQGVPINIMRPATITWATTEQPFINDDAFLKFYKACLDIAAYPHSSLKVNLVPVDFVAQSITAITETNYGNSKNFHLVSADSLNVEQIYHWFIELGCQLQGYEFTEWQQRLQDNFVAGFINLYFKDGMDNGGHHQYAMDNLLEAIEPFNIPSFKVDKNYFIPLINKFNNKELQ